MEARVDVWSTRNAVCPGLGPLDFNMRVGCRCADTSCASARPCRGPSGGERAGAARLVQISRVATDSASENRNLDPSNFGGGDRSFTPRSVRDSRARRRDTSRGSGIGHCFLVDDLLDRVAEQQLLDRQLLLLAGERARDLGDGEDVVRQEASGQAASIALLILAASRRRIRRPRAARRTAACSCRGRDIRGRRRGCRAPPATPRSRNRARSCHGAGRAG